MQETKETGREMRRNKSLGNHGKYLLLQISIDWSPTRWRPLKYLIEALVALSSRGHQWEISVFETLEEDDPRTCPQVLVQRVVVECVCWTSFLWCQRLVVLWLPKQKQIGFVIIFFVFITCRCLRAEPAQYRVHLFSILMRLMVTRWNLFRFACETYSEFLGLHIFAFALRILFPWTARRQWNSPCSTIPVRPTSTQQKGNGHKLSYRTPRGQINKLLEKYAEQNISWSAM